MKINKHKWSPKELGLLALLFAIVGPVSAGFYNYNSQQPVNSCSGDFCGIGVGIAIAFKALIIGAIFELVALVLVICALRRKHSNKKR